MTRISKGLLAGAFGVVVLAGSTSTGAQAQGLLDVRMLSAPLANQLVGDAVASCAKQGYAVTAVVVDLDGVRQAVLRGDRAPIHTVDFAYNKAYSAATLTLARKEDSTKAVAERMSKNPASTLPATPPPHITYAAGGISDDAWPAVPPSVQSASAGLQAAISTTAAPARPSARSRIS